jgi:hypothetical protein|tara:strand:+ start:452 stop:1081 length:630 start_codon:yes stop_codon:yes gene_type:complete
MKNILTIIALFLLISCSEENNNEVPKSFKTEEPITPSSEYTYSLGDVTVKWTAFKHSARAQVGGEFKSAEVLGFQESTDLNTSISGVSFKIPVSSTSTNDEVRDYKVVNSFFNTMISTEFITGKIISIDENGQGKLSINMNGQGLDKVFKWEMDETTKEIYIKTSIDVLNWGAKSSLDALNEVCLEQHTGPDGKNVLWPNVDITVIVDL